MAPNSRIFLTRHAQAEHNVDLDYSIPDAPLTPLGKKQAASLSPQLEKYHDKIDLVVSSPLQRTLQTTKLGWASAVGRLGIKNVICLPEAQECNDFPCDTGSPKEALEANPELAGFDFSRLKPEWTSKKGFWAPESKTERARWVRQFLRERPEKNIVLVAHGDILRSITGNKEGESTYMWKNAEVREFVFDPKSVETEDCFLVQEENVAAAGGYAPSSSEADLVWGNNGKL
ncbi:hypothetical protein PRZ48_011327 [Zasmidium cellare]|uniref:Phosphoglycerate mutase-like protein n=1 Tax=Zasmidium cellare TaxID=395010 RepID=A0ABR0E616_ZASCE|nr:hypothetical protein PRZ48_011327 [Zasmidium cellare]